MTAPPVEPPVEPPLDPVEPPVWPPLDPGVDAALGVTAAEVAVACVLSAVAVACTLAVEGWPVEALLSAKMAKMPMTRTIATIPAIQIHRLRRGLWGGVGKLGLGNPCVGVLGLLIIVCLSYSLYLPIHALQRLAGNCIWELPFSLDEFTWLRRLFNFIVILLSVFPSFVLGTKDGKTDNRITIKTDANAEGVSTQGKRKGQW